MDTINKKRQIAHQRHRIPFIKKRSQFIIAL